MTLTASPATFDLDAKYRVTDGGVLVTGSRRSSAWSSTRSARTGGGTSTLPRS
jgi:hypothetical protein